MVSLRLKYVVEDVDRHGNVRIYFRRPGFKKLRLKGLPGSLEFQAVYSNALRLTEGKPVAPKHSQDERGSMAWLCQGYYRSADFQRLDGRTQHGRRLILDGLCASGAGPLPYSKLTVTSILRWRDSKSDRPEAANSLIKALRQLFAFAIEYRLAGKNPAKDVRYLKGNSEGFHSWSGGEIGRFEPHHSLGSPVDPQRSC